MNQYEVSAGGWVAEVTASSAATAVSRGLKSISRGRASQKQPSLDALLRAGSRVGISVKLLPKAKP